MKESHLWEMFENWTTFAPGMKEYFARAIEELEKDREEMNVLSNENAQLREYVGVLEKQLELVREIMRSTRKIEFPTYIKKELNDGIL